MEIKSVKINLEKTDHIFVGKFEKVLFDGYLILYKKYDEINNENEDDEADEKKDKNQKMNKSLENMIKKLNKDDNVFHCLRRYFRKK